jgi:hypothetical protein
VRLKHYPTGFNHLAAFYFRWDFICRNLLGLTACPNLSAWVPAACTHGHLCDFDGAASSQSRIGDVHLWLTAAKIWDVPRSYVKGQYALPAAGIASLVKRRFFCGVTKEQMFASLWPSQGLTSIKDQRGK